MAVGRVRRCKVFSGRPLPSFPEKLAESCRCIPVDEDLDLMIGPVCGSGIIAAQRIIHHVLRGIPAVLGQIDASAKSDAIVDYNELLMLGCTDRMATVQVKVDPAMGFPPQVQNGQPFPLPDEQHGKIPSENVGVELTSAGRFFIQQLAQPSVFKSRVRTALQEKPAVDVPRRNVDRPCRALDGLREGVEVGRRVYQKREFVGLGYAPTCISFSQNPMSIVTGHSPSH